MGACWGQVATPTLGSARTSDWAKWPSTLGAQPIALMALHSLPAQSKTPHDSLKLSPNSSWLMALCHQSTTHRMSSEGSGAPLRHPDRHVAHTTQTHRADDRRHWPFAPPAGQAHHAGKHPRVNVQPGIVQPRLWNILGGQVPGSAAGACDVEVTLAVHMRTYTERRAILEITLSAEERPSSPTQ